MVLNVVVVEGASSLAVDVDKSAVIVKASEILLVDGYAGSESNTHVKGIDVVAVVVVDVIYTKNHHLVSVGL